MKNGTSAPKNAPQLNPPPPVGNEPLQITTTLAQSKKPPIQPVEAQIGSTQVIDNTTTIEPASQEVAFASIGPVELPPAAPPESPPPPISPSELAQQFGLEDPAQPPAIGPVKQELPVCEVQPPGTPPQPPGPTIGPASPEVVQQFAMQQLTEAQAQYDATKAQVDVLDQKLGAQLSEVGPSLTPEQQAAYVKEYHEAHPEYAQLEKDAANLEEALSNPDLDDAIEADPEAAKAAYQGLKSLADSPLGGKAIEIAKGWKADGATWSALSAATPNFATKFEEEVLAPALPAATADKIADGWPLADVAADTIATLRAFDGAASIPRHVVEMLDQLSRGTLPKTAAFKEMVENFEALDDLGKAVGGVAAILSLDMAIAAGAEGDYLNMLSYGSTGAALGAPVLAEVFKTTRWGMHLPKAATFLERMTPVIGAASSAIATYQDWLALQDPNSPKVGAFISLLGDATATVGGALVAGSVLFPPAAIPGELLNAVGTVVAMGGYAVTQIESGAARMNEERKLLTQVFKDQGLSDLSARTMADAIARGAFTNIPGDPAAAQEQFLAVPQPFPAQKPSPLSTPIPIRG